MTANADKMETMCECQHTFATVSGDGEGAWMKDKILTVPNIHEIDEDSETEGETIASTQPGPSVTEEKNIAQDTENTSEDESAYTDESFCSDESCDETEVIDVTAPGSLSASDSSSSLPRTAHHERSGNVEPADARISTTLSSLRPRLRNEEFDSANDEPPRVITADRFARPRRCRKWNMSFTDEEMRRIERDNEQLLRKIMAQQKPRHKVTEEHIVQSRTSSSAINRRKLQKRIDDDNMVYNFLQSWACLK